MGFQRGVRINRPPQRTISLLSETEERGRRAWWTLEGILEVGAALVVIELQVLVVAQGYREAEGPVSGRGLRVVEVRLPPVQVSRQSNRMVREFTRGDVVRSAPDEIPIFRRLDTDTHLK